MAEAKLKEYKGIRKIVKGGVTRIKTYLNSVDPQNVNQEHLIRRREKLEGFYREFENAQAQIEILSAEEDDVIIDENERNTFESIYYELMAKLADLIVSPNVPSAATTVPSNTPQRDSAENIVNNSIRLPRIELPTFSGSYEDWYTFYDTFKSLIEANSSLSAIQKFHYLKSALKGEAAEVISSLEITAAHYAHAWSMLKDRYDNKRLIVQRHIRAIFDLPSLNKENHILLRKLVDGFLKHMRALEALQRPTNSWDDVMIHVITAKLDSVTLKEWEMSQQGNVIPDLLNLTEFLNQRCQTLEAVARNLTTSAAQPKASVKVNHSKVSAYHGSTIIHSCLFCNNDHTPYKCEYFKGLALENRLKECKTRNICTNCLRSKSHTSRQCTSGNCRKCGKHHNTKLHFESYNSDKKANAENKDSNVNESNTITPSTSTLNNTIANALPLDKRKSPPVSQAILSTVLLHVRDKHGDWQKCRALLDSGSQMSYITEGLVERLQIQTSKTNVTVACINKTESRSHFIARVNIKSRINNYRTKLECLVLKRLTENLPLSDINRNGIIIPRGITLADPNFHKSAPVDMLVGVDIFWDLICIGFIKKSHNQPVWQKTKLGWIAAGGLAPSINTEKALCHYGLASLCLDDKLTKFWDIEQYPDKPPLTTEEKICEESFQTTYKRDGNGRFIVQLPVKTHMVTRLGESSEVARKRFHSMESKFLRQPELGEQYKKFMSEYRELGHMLPIEKYTKDEVNPTYVMPHHSVLKEDSLTTKLRVVFDASCKTTSGVSLNDALMTGPILQKDLVDILIRFRLHRITLTADIAKMYRQVLVDKSQRSLQRIWWRDNHNEDVGLFELTTLTYGTAPASFLAVRCLHELATLEKDKFPHGSQVVLHDFYMDDLITGAEDIQSAVVIYEETKSLLAKGCFEIRKWASNCSEILTHIRQEASDDATLVIEKEDNARTLGILWKSKQDTFQYNLPQIEKSKVTKRSILSSVAGIFDPLGLIGPTIIIAKLLLQQLWQMQIQWDESVPSEIYSRWMEFVNGMQEISSLSVPRCVKPDIVSSIELHGFSDASEHAYGACVYVRYADCHAIYKSNLLCAKSRIAPLKIISLPRLELCAALLLAKLMHKIMSNLRISIAHAVYWTDSTITLAWIKSSARRWNTFVAHRVGEIQTLSNPSLWRHVEGKMNPADTISRGQSPAKLLANDLWWYGPPWLCQGQHTWQEDILNMNEDDLPEQKRAVVNTHTLITQNDNLFEKFSSFTRLVRIVALCLRFTHNLQHPSTKKIVGNLRVYEIEAATRRLVSLVQASSFPDELKCLKQGKGVSKNSKLVSLSPFIDDNGLIRVGGRLRNSLLPYDHKFPFLLPAKHRLTELIIEREHKRQLHAGAQATLAAIRTQFWPLAARSLVRKIIRRCVICFKANPVSSQPAMGDLPIHRVEPARPFINSGIDYCGPFYIRDRKGRGAKNTKAYVAVFVCFAVKAVHLELVGDLSAEAFIGALKRFISRRGRVAHLYSDNGTNFIGAERELRELRELFLKEQRDNFITNTLANENIQWHFIPPRGPHFGGLWEAAVKSAKQHLRRVASDAALTFEEFYTLLVQIEAVLNSRPIIPLSSDPNDYSALSPAHFLIGDSLTAPLEPNLVSFKVNRLSRWQHIEQLKQHFWQRWSKEYLNNLQQRVKWKKDKGDTVKVGQLVLLKEDDSPPLRWPTARIEEVHPGDDGKIRAITIRTAKGLLKRPTNKICCLPEE